jgi:hypothetical protein
MASVGRVAATTCWGRRCPHTQIFRGKPDSAEALIIFCFFLAQECQHTKKKEKRCQYSPWRPWVSHSYHLAEVSLPTPQGLISQDTRAGQDASTAGFAGPPYACESDKEPTAEDGPEDTMDAADRPFPPSMTKL